MNSHAAIVIDRPGGPDALKLQSVLTRAPGEGEILVEVVAAGVNFMDTGTRTGQNGPGPFPVIPGVEGAGRVLQLGQGVDYLHVGQRIAWRFAWGSYGEKVTMSAAQAVPLPDNIDFETAAAILLQGLTAQHFTNGFYRVREADTVLLHAAAGGVGLLVAQLAKRQGARVIGRVSDERKVASALSAGVDDVIVNSDGHFLHSVMELTSGRGVDVVYDGSGTTTYVDSIASLKVHGVMAYYGPAVDTAPPVQLASLPNSILIGYPTVDDHVRTRGELLRHSAELFELVARGQLAVAVGQTYPLRDAAQAHRDLHGRLTTGKLLLVP
ncbi:hypothetical protein B7R22_13970 [Subtercola boreus]|uniref:Enoyl reductase (ER) domain-containing protein n=1 Tax=Subtercola boreus TaxID=120213 RepID=A0A3E0VUR8_9MICO|nr:quinone oxidoreductase [Subtercola boreus]RFA13103.1 hypothetical protein B7R22_13970 [Subtercola boreus]